jgi:hypothetical protein
MTLPLIASVIELQDRTGETYTGTEATRAAAALADASDLARFEASSTWVDEAGTTSTAPAAAKVVVLKAAARAMDNPEGLTVETDGDYSQGRQGRDDVADGVYFTEDERRVLAALGDTPTGLFTLSTAKGPGEADAYACRRSNYVFPWSTVEDL